jgi:serine/threonine protein kinase
MEKVSDCGTVLKAPESDIQFNHFRYLVLPSFERKSLIDLLIWLSSAVEKGRLSKSELTRIRKFLIGEAVRTLHNFLTTTELAHGDIKPDNYVVDENYKLKLIDLASCIIANQETSDNFGTQEYFAPELFGSSSRIPASADIFSLGVTIFCIWFLLPPF